MLTVFVIAGTGTVLALKKDFAALQPPTQEGSAPGELRRPVGDLVAAVATLPAHRATRWQDVDRIDIRPSDGVAKVILHSRTEIQVDLATGRPLQTGYRTSDWLETVHDFSIFGAWAKYVFSFGSGLLILCMAASGVYLFLLPLLVKRRKRRIAAAGNLGRDARARST
jgi:uncharacterized iron-regulated membrane protein